MITSSPSLLRDELMEPPGIACARHMRDGGIDAMAALNDALRDALAGLTPQEQHELAFGQVMGEIGEKPIQPGGKSFSRAGAKSGHVGPRRPITCQGRVA
ncbi:hypothetical protein ACQQ2N_14355 [Dokdonella sp. MW10]|uniref:hypothetical protein n=1 Tax=Dokdonella sp. MW10 TaxID=2992926 RepID=UPI003F810AF0